MKKKHYALPLLLSIDYQQTELMLYADAQSFQLLLVELIDNAILHAFPEGKTGQIRLWIKCLPEHWELHYEDNGMGFSASSPDKVFEPFYTTRSNGTGLGLAVVQAVATSHNGIARCLPGTSGGARFELVLPVCPATVRTAAGGASLFKESSHAEAQNSGC